MSSFALGHLWNSGGRSDRVEYLCVAGPALLALAVGGALFKFVYPDRPDDFGLLVGLPLLFPSVGILMLAALRRIHDLDRPAWWIFGFGIVIRLVGFGAAQLGLAAMADEIQLAAAGIGFAYLAVRAGTIGPNRYGAEPARFSGRAPALPALALFKPQAHIPDARLPELFQLCAYPEHLQLIVAQAQFSFGTVTLVDSRGESFTGSRRSQGLQAEYVFTATETPPFAELKARIVAGYEAGAPWWSDEDGPPPPEHLALTNSTLASLKAADKLEDIFATFEDEI